MKKIVLVISVLAIVGLLFPQCDKIEEPYLETPSGPDPDPDPDPDPTAPQDRNILLLDFTGHQCGNCPGGHRTIKQLQNSFGERLIPIAVHATYFARFDTGASKYNYNFTCAEGIELAGETNGNSGYFPVTVLPQGVVNSFAKDKVEVQGNWGTEVGEYIGQKTKFNIDIESELNDDESQSQLNITVTAIENADLDLKLGVYIVESGIINWQLDYSADPQDIPDYTHDHVLRGSYNGTFGESLNNESSISKDQVFEKSYSLNLGSDWVVDNCYAIAFVYDNDSKEILHVKEVHLK